MADKSPIGYIPSTSPEAMEANRAYQEALARLNESLDMRKNRIIDPRWAAVTKAFSTPGQTGSGAETIGRVMGALGEAETGMALEEQNIAKNQLDVAAQGIQLQKQKENERTYRQMMGLEPLAGALPSAAPAGPSGGALPGPAGPQGGQAPAGGAAAPRQFGIQIAPPQLGLTKNQFLAGALAEGVNSFEAAKQWDEIERKSREPKEGGIFDIRSGMFFPAPGAGTEERQIPLPDGSRGTIKLPKYIANILDDAALRNDWVTFNNIVRQFINYGRGMSASAQGAAPSVAAAPSAATAAPSAAAPSAKGSAAPGRVQTVEEQEAEKRRLEIERSSKTRLEEKRAEASAAREAELPKIDENARRVYGSATRVIDNVTKSPNYFGLFERPGFVASIGTILNSIRSTPEGTVERGVVEDAMRKMMPNVKQEDLDAVTNAAADLAEIELAYTQLYLAKQGAVTEGERVIVRKLGGGVSQSPGVLKARMQLLKERSQYDIDRVDAFRQWQEQNPSGTIDQFDRSTDAKNLKSTFEKRLSTIFGGAPAIPSRERKAAEPPTSKDTPSNEDLRKKLDKWRSQNG